MKQTDKKIITQVMSALEENNMQCFFVRTKQEACSKVAELLNDGDTVAVGGSMSLAESGVMDLLRSGKYNFLDRYDPSLDQEGLHNIFIKSMNADAFLCSSNAVTHLGELYNVDGRANRISAISFGPKSVIMVVGINKIVPDIDEAIQRVKTIAAPKNCNRLGANTYCKTTGQCVSIVKGADGMTSGCDSPSRICCSYLISGKQQIKDRIKVILVGEALGY